MQQTRSMQEQAQDKQFLRDIIKHNFAIPEDIDSFTFAKALLANLASPDSELRDTLSYMILARGLIDQQMLTVPQMEELLLTCIDQDHLFHHINEPGTDAVFLRSFSNLIIAALLYADAKKAASTPQVQSVSDKNATEAKEGTDHAKVVDNDKLRGTDESATPELQTLRLPKETIGKAKAALLRYAREERDWRGYVQGKGWAHALAHLADALDECAQNASMTAEDRRQILETVRELAKVVVPLFDEEDMRLATVAYHMIICKQLNDTILSDWLESCYVERGEDMAAWKSLVNARNFLRSLYFQLSWDTIGLHFADQISRILKRMDAVFVEGNDTTA